MSRDGQQIADTDGRMVGVELRNVERTIVNFAKVVGRMNSANCVIKADAAQLTKITFALTHLHHGDSKCPFTKGRKVLIILKRASANFLPGWKFSSFRMLNFARKRSVVAAQLKRNIMQTVSINDKAKNFSKANKIKIKSSQTYQNFM